MKLWVKNRPVGRTDIILKKARGPWFGPPLTPPQLKFVVWGGLGAPEIRPHFAPKILPFPRPGNSFPFPLRIGFWGWGGGEGGGPLVLSPLFNESPPPQGVGGCFCGFGVFFFIFCLLVCLFFLVGVIVGFWVFLGLFYLLLFGWWMFLC